MVLLSSLEDINKRLIDLIPQRWGNDDEEDED